MKQDQNENLKSFFQSDSRSLFPILSAFLTRFRAMWKRTGLSFQFVGPLLALSLGIFLRLLWPGDMEYKGDEAFHFQMAKTFGQNPYWPTLQSVFSFRLPDFFASWPAVGQPSSAGLPNFGFSVWCFGLLGFLSGAQDPETLGQAVQCLNSVGLVIFFLFIIQQIPQENQERWLWVLALVAVNPFEVFLQRKIWPPSLFPVLTMSFFLAWWHKDRKWGAFLYGCLGLLLGQLQMSGFFFAFAWLICTWIWQRTQLHWKSWWMGTAVGAFPMLPWGLYCLQHPEIFSSVNTHYADFVQYGARFHPYSSWMDHCFFPFFWMAMSQTFGLGLDYSLHHEMTEFLKWPSKDFKDTYGMAWLHLSLCSLALFLIVLTVYLGVCSVWRAKAWRGWFQREDGVRRFCRKVCQAIFHQKSLQSNRAILAGVAGSFGFGCVLTWMPIYIHRHYLIVSSPWMAWILVQWAYFVFSRGFQRGLLFTRFFLGFLWCCQLGLTFGFLSYIHQQGGARGGDYGIALSHQR